MAPLKKKSQDALKHLTRTLYSPKTAPPERKRSGLSKTDQIDTADEKAQPLEMIQRSQKKERRKTATAVKIIFYGALAFFIMAIGYAGFTFYQQTNVVSSDKIDFELELNPFADSGEEIEVIMHLTNKNSTALEDASITLESPRAEVIGIVDTQRDTVEVGRALPGQTYSNSFPVVVFGEQGAVRELRAILRYSLAGSNAIYEKEVTSQVTIRTTPIDILVTSREEVVSGQETTLTVELISRSVTSLKNLKLSVDVPTGFNLTDSDPEFGAEDNSWIIPELGPSESNVITIKGNFEGQRGDVRAIKFIVSGVNDSGEAVVLNSSLKRFTLVRPFVAADIYISSVSDSTIALGSNAEVKGLVWYYNTFDDTLNNTSITLSIDGETWDPESVTTNGTYSPKNGTITWDSANTQALEIIDPQESGSLEFSFKLKATKQDGGLFTQPEISLATSVTSLDTTGNLRQTAQADEMSIRQISAIGLGAETLHRTGPFANSGPVPPVIEQETTYTMRIFLTNSINDLDNVVVRTSLPRYTRWLGQTSASQGTISYNDFGKELTWEVGSISSLAGYQKGSPELLIQVGVTPEFSQIGSEVKVIDDISVRGRDTFTGAWLDTNRESTTTNIRNEGADRNSGRVIRGDL